MPDEIQPDETLLAWEFDEYDHYDRGMWWYVIAGGVCVALLLYAVFSGNFLFALVVIMGAVLIYIKTIVHPKKVAFAITETGVVIHKTAYSFRDLKTFWFCYHPPAIKKMYLEFQGYMHPRLSIGLEDQDPNDVRELIGRFVREDADKEDEPASDIVGRILKI